MIASLQYFSVFIFCPTWCYNYFSNFFGIFIALKKSQNFGAYLPVFHVCP